MNWMKKLTVAGLVTAAALTAGCRDSHRVEVDDDKIEMERGTGGGGLDIGDREGVLNDGEGPLEERNRDDIRLKDDDAVIGDRPGVMNDGEGPLEERGGLPVGDKPGIFNDGEGPLEERGGLPVGEKPGILNDGEGPLEERKDKRQ